ncbi:MAG: hypothetical protein OXE99_14015 [Cellvibrionales bacterium]|nr:hypothetical protein [Cellvibrionales bacterium]
MHRSNVFLLCIVFSDAFAVNELGCVVTPTFGSVNIYDKLPPGQKDIAIPKSLRTAIDESADENIAKAKFNQYVYSQLCRMTSADKKERDRTIEHLNNMRFLVETHKVRAATRTKASITHIEKQIEGMHLVGHFLNGKELNVVDKLGWFQGFRDYWNGTTTISVDTVLKYKTNGCRLRDHMVSQARLKRKGVLVPGKLNINQAMGDCVSWPYTLHQDYSHGKDEYSRAPTCKSKEFLNLMGVYIKGKKLLIVMYIKLIAAKAACQ